jgi:hypothetical protein
VCPRCDALEIERIERSLDGVAQLLIHASDQLEERVIDLDLDLPNAAGERTTGGISEEPPRLRLRNSEIDDRAHDVRAA